VKQPDLPTYHAMPPLGGDNPRPFGAPWAGPLIADELKRAERAKEAYRATGDAP